MENSNSKNTYAIQNDKEVIYSRLNGNISLLHDPYSINHIHGLRNRMFKTFHTFATILDNALLPPVLKNTKKVHIKFKESDQQAKTNYILKFNSMLSEIKKESTNENLHTKKSITNVTLRKIFQMKLIQCYKLAIDATVLCSKTLEANIYHPIQSKLIILIQLISGLSLTTGKYLYGASFKKMKKESFDLVEYCKGLKRMLVECGYKDTENETHDNNVLNKLANKALAKTTYTSLNNLSMYNRTKPKLGSTYAQRWTQKSLNSSKIQNVNDKHVCNCKMINEKSLLLKNDTNLSFDNTMSNNNFDNLTTLIQEYPIEKLDINETNNTLVSKEIKYKMFNNCTDEVSNLSILSKTLKFNELKTPNNVKLIIVKENAWRKCPIKNVRVSQNGRLILYINPEQIESNCLYKRQFRQSSLITESQIHTLSNITELIMKDLINEVLSKIHCDALITRLIRMELLE